MEDALSLGFIGRNGAYPANEAGRHADLVVAIGARFDDRSASSWIAGLFLEFPALQAHPRRRRSGRARPQLSARSRHPGRCAHFPAPAAGRAGAAAIARRRARCLARARSKTGRPNGRHSRAEFRDPCLADAAGARGRRLPGGAARRRDPHLRCRRQPQLVHAVLEGAPAADHAQLVGLLRHGLRRRRRARRQARGARPARASRSPATAASPWCRTCCAPRSSTTSRWSG